jgi:hypothetical protein
MKCWEDRFAFEINFKANKFWISLEVIFCAGSRGLHLVMEARRQKRGWGLVLYIA